MSIASDVYGDDAGTVDSPTLSVVRMHHIRPRLIGACSIHVGDQELSPAASHVFAVLLALILTPRDSWTRRTLQELLFAGADDTAAAHRLRQLLYRLRSLGVALQESPEGLLRIANPIEDILADADPFGRDVPSGEAASTVLGLYTPRMPAPYLEWLEERRTILQRTLANRRLAELRTARERQDWPACVAIARRLRFSDPLDEELVTTLAEAEAMLGRRDAALEVVDDFLRESHDTVDSRPQLRKLRARILSTRVPRREGTLRGREACLAFLSEQWDLTQQEVGARACVILGPAGMGKTRVGESYAGVARLSGGQVIHHRCDEHARSSPLSLFTRLVPDLRQRRGSIGADPALSVVLDHFTTAAASLESAPVSPEQRRDEVKRAIVDLFEAVTSEQPMLLVVDDAHLLDEASRAVLRALVEGQNSAQLLVLLLCRPRPDIGTMMSRSGRLMSYTLTPLSVADSRALFLELAGGRYPVEDEIATAVAKAEGNAFYINTLAQHPLSPVSLPAHIRSLAQTSYLGIGSDARSILDAALLLDTLASPDRVMKACALDDRSMLPALRELEDADLLRFELGILVGPHAILREALSDLTPSMGRAILQRRVAALLESECESPTQARIVGWTAVRSWLSAGELTRAGQLAIKVSRRAAELGEPEAGAILLSQVPRTGLTVELRRAVLDETIQLAECGNCTAILPAGLRERLDLARLTGEGGDVIAGLTNRFATTEFIHSARLDAGPLFELLEDTSVSVDHRADAASRLLATADLALDRRSAGG